MHETAGMGNLINAALLSDCRRLRFSSDADIVRLTNARIIIIIIIINEACVSMCYPPPESTLRSCLCADTIE